MSFPGRSRRTQQPSQFVPIDRTDPLYRDLADVFYPQRATSRPMGGASTVLTRDGLGFTTSGTADWWLASPAGVASLSANWTILTVVNGATTNTSSGANLYCERPNDTQIIKLGISGGSSNNGAQLVVRDLSGNLIILTGNANVKTDSGSRRVVVATRRASNDHRIYVNGAFDNSATGNINGAFGASAAVIGNDPQDTASTLNGAGVSLVMVWRRALSDAEIARASREIWGGLAPAPRQPWLAYVQSVSDTSVSPTPGALQVTGYAPAIARGVTTNVSPAAGSIAVAGYAPSVTQSLNTQVSPGAGALQVAGYAPSVVQTASRTVAPAPGSIAVAGYAPTVVRGSSLTIQAGAPTALTVTGYAPIVTQAGNVIPHYAGATIMRLSSVRSTTILGPARLQQTTGFP